MLECLLDSTANNTENKKKNLKTLIFGSLFGVFVYSLYLMYGLFIMAKYKCFNFYLEK